MDAPKFEYFLRKYEDSENQSIQPKNYSPRMHIITGVFEEKTMLRLQDKNHPVQECLYLLACLKDFDDNIGRREMSHFENANISKDV